ncbi:MAG: glycoside hydrolase family 97 protein [Candidatus Marinimicrobia bacterium]|nr:glycoside hydrolase family 97 protein [Candidatus Neomarinimicrobiota bacterium]
MQKIRHLYPRITGLTIILIILSNCTPDSGNSQTVTVQAPDGLTKIEFRIQEGKPYYRVIRTRKALIDWSRLGIRLKSEPSLDSHLMLTNTVHSSFDETWEQPWGEVREIRNHYNQLKVELTSGAQGRLMNIVFRAFNDGIGFRYEFPEQENLQDFVILDELTEFVLNADHQAWWIGAYQHNRYEYLYSQTAVSEIDTVHTPLTMQTADGIYLSIHEAALTDYASMTLENRGDNRLKCDLVPWAEGDKVRAAAPHVSPWRTIQIAENPVDLITSYLILNLNEPNRLDDVSWITPAKYIGIWWGMHIGTYTWGSGDKHGATTANVQCYIDFAAKHGFPGVLVEGWNTGWDGDWVANGDIFSFTEAHLDFDLSRLSTYAARKGVKIIGHHETSAGTGNYEAQLEDASKLYQQHGINTVKTGYVGHGQNIIRYENGKPTERQEWHHGQYMVRHYRKVVETAARHGIMLDVHEPIKDTGIRRTWPNMMTREGARGQEFNAWGPDGGNPPDYTTILPFTRCLSGPFDFTPGIFDLFFEQANRPDSRVNTTLAKQLALYVVIYSPLHMAADLPENYRDHPAFQFIKDVPTDWEETIVLNGEIGDFITIARQDRNSGDWYIGSISDENGRVLEITLDFLDPKCKYRAEIYADAPEADWKTNPYAYEIKRKKINYGDCLILDLAPGGGAAIRLVEESG